MPAQPEKAHTLDELRRLVRTRICKPHHLDSDQCVMTEELLLRRGRPCGVVFCLHGPRLVRFSAIWVADEQAVYMYDSTGARYAKLLLEEGPPLPAQAA